MSASPELNQKPAAAESLDVPRFDPPKELTVTGKDGKIDLTLEPTDRKGVYNIPEGVLTTSFVSMAEVYEDTGIESAPYDWY
jgi:hypothetical protein